MPELPEAETIVRDLRPQIVGVRVRRVDVVHADILGAGLTPATLDRGIAGRRFTAVARRGKNVVLHVEDRHIVAINLGMTGRLVTAASARAGELRHTAVRFLLDGGDTLVFDDMRRFGRVQLFDANGWAIRNAELGLEPLGPGFTATALYALTRASRLPIRNFLLDQARVAGVGNIYANEALFRAGIRPTRRARRLTRADAACLRDSLRDVLHEAIAARGTTLRDYRDGKGEAGGFEPRLRVYGRQGEACPVCGSGVRRVVLTNRSAYYCPVCQR